jgi:[ribosomal protein S5]-alanine N-acetyltransferase
MNPSGFGTVRTAQIQRPRGCVPIRHRTERLELILQTPAEAMAWLESLPPADRAEVSQEWIERARYTSPGDYWALSFQVVQQSDGAVVGGCAFKGPPDAESAVEMAYGIDEAYRCKGFATEVARGLLAIATASGLARTVRAHTRSQHDASSRVLTKCGLQYIGDAIDPDDGLVRRWEINISSIP